MRQSIEEYRVNTDTPGGEISTEVDGVIYFGQMTIENRMVTVTTGLSSKSKRRGRLKAETVGRLLLAELIREDARILQK